jgi:hypothetical protein
MRALEFGMGRFRGDTLCGLKGFLQFLSDFFESHKSNLNHFQQSCNAPLVEKCAWESVVGAARCWYQRERALTIREMVAWQP